MIPELKKNTKTARLPVTACTPEFREQIRDFARAKNVSESELIRVSLQFFLAANVGEVDNRFGEKKLKKRSKAAS